MLCYRVYFANECWIHLSCWQSNIEIFLEGELKKHFLLSNFMVIIFKEALTGG